LSLYLTVPALRERKEMQPWWQFVTFTENLFIDFTHGKTFSHVWSLCVEEHFYLVFPLLSAAVLWRPSARLTLMVAGLIVAAGLVIRAHLWFDRLVPLAGITGAGNPQQRWYEWIYYPTYTRLDGLVMGVLLAVMRAQRPRLWHHLLENRAPLLLAGALGFGGAVWLFQETASAGATVLGYPLLSVALACFVAVAARPSMPAVPGASFVAAVSYSVYLTHKQALHVLHVAAAEVLDGTPALAVAAYGGLTLAFGTVLHFSVERPFLKLRDRHLRASHGACPSSPAPRGRGCGSETSTSLADRRSAPPDAGDSSPVR
jgi:peptidoglycan/LPS O-acetylase OafA/YrhL